MRHFWTNEELLFLRKNYQGMTDKELSEKLNISISSISSKRFSLRYLRKFTYQKASCLSEQEKTILTLLLKGLTYKECAKKLVLAETTIKTHVNNIFQKLNVHSLPKLIASCYGKQVAELESYIQMLEEQNKKQIEIINGEILGK